MFRFSKSVVLFLVVALIVGTIMPSSLSRVSASEGQPSDPLVFSFLDLEFPGKPKQDDWNVVGFMGDYPAILDNDTYAQIIATTVGQYREFAFKIAESGVYSIQLQGYTTRSGSTAEIRIDERLINTYNFYSDSGSSEGTLNNLGSVYLDEGAHILKLTPVGPSDYRMYPMQMVLEKSETLAEISEVSLELFPEARIGQASKVIVRTEQADGTFRDLTGIVTNFTTSDPQVAMINSSGVLTPLTTGEVTIEASFEYNGSTQTASLDTTVGSRKLVYTFSHLGFPGSYKQAGWDIVGGFDDSPMVRNDRTYSVHIASLSVGAKRDFMFQVPATGNYQIDLNNYRTNLGGIAAVEIDGQELGEVSFYNSSTVASQEQIGVMHLTSGEHKLTLKVTDKDPGNPESAASLLYRMDPSQLILTRIDSGEEPEIPEFATAKTRSTIYTPNKINAARNNVENYDWAKLVKNEVVAEADRYVALGLDYLWRVIPPHTLPRSYSVNELKGSPVTGNEIDKFGSYPYIIDPINDPWKITDPSSGYKFPTNDFKSYYESGLDDNGIFQKDLADPQYLINELYPDKGETWGVDDGFGWVNENGDRFVFVAYYVHWGLWGYSGGGLIQKMLRSLRDAYIYTGDAKYAQAGTVLLDRIADVYPEHDITDFDGSIYLNSDGGHGQGKVLGSIWETFLVKDFLYAYDAFYPAMNDSVIIDFLTERSEAHHLGPLKWSANGIRKNIEVNIVEHMYPAMQKAQLQGNEGMHQSAVALAAVVYDKLPETKVWLDYIFQAGGLERNPTRITGGNLGPILVNQVDRDGHGDEASPEYNQVWLNYFMEIADILNGYDKYTLVDLYQHVKFRKLFSAQYPLMLIERYTAQIGDSGQTGNPGTYVDIGRMIRGFEQYGDPIFAQLAHFANGNSTEGLHGDIYSADANELAARIQAVIEEYGPLQLPSVNLTGYGFAALRDGTNSKTAFSLVYKFPQLPIIDRTAEYRLYDDGALQFEALDIGEQISFEFEVPKADSYEIRLRPFIFNTYGTYMIKIDGEDLLEFDFSNASPTLQPIGTVNLARGKHTITFFNTGKNENASGFKLAIYEMALLDEEERERLDGDSEAENTLRSLWMYYGRNTGHGHLDTLNIGLHAYGLDLSPDMGYPEFANATDKHRWEFLRNTISHNTVVVDRAGQKNQWVATPTHFDDTEMVKFIDVEAPHVYPQTSLYKRTTAMIRVDETHSYAVDFFRVNGGNEHVFSFHGAEGATTADGLNLTEQSTGTYAGPNVEYGNGTTEISSGYHFLKNVERDPNPGNQFSVDWHIEDTYKILGTPSDIHLRLTMMGEVDEVALADGIPPQNKPGNPESLRYMLAKRTGSNLQSLFTSVLEPYKEERYITAIAPAIVKLNDTVITDHSVRAIKVTLKNGRVDYIVSALDPTILYTVDDKLQFKGFFGVYAEQNGQSVHRYVNDGNVIGTEIDTEAITSPGALTGTIVDFTKDLRYENELIVQMNLQGVALESLINKSIYVKNDGVRNAAYLIRGVSATSTENQYKLDIGEATLIRSYRDNSEFGRGYVYDVAASSSFRIPLSHEPFVGLVDFATIDVVAEDQEIAVGKTTALKVTGYTENGSPVDLSSATLSFASDNEQAATAASDGTITARGKGEAIITVAATLRGVTRQATIVIRVIDVPAAPTNVQAEAGDGEAIVTFTSPVEDGGSLITSYEVSASPGPIAVIGTASPIRVPGLTNGVSYTFTVKAINEAGKSISSAASAPVVPVKKQISSGGGYVVETVVIPHTAKDAVILINGKPYSIATESQASRGGKAVSIITLGGDEWEELLEISGQQSVISVSSNDQTNAVVGELDGLLVRALQAKQSVLEIRTNHAVYTLPVSLISLDELAADLGVTANLEDLKLRIEIVEPTASMAIALESAGKSGGFSVVGTPVEFKVYATAGGATVEISRFDAYVERKLIIPADVDPGSITTGVVLDEDGSIRHVPTQIVQENEGYVAKINSVTNSLYALIQKKVVFSDVTNHWSQAIVNDLGARLIINGDNARLFHPNQDITRGEFVAIVVRALGLKLTSGTSSFTDVSNGWYASAVHTATSYGLINGFPDGTFRPNERITREQAIVVVARTMEIAGMSSTTADAHIEQSLSFFKDGDELSEWARNNVSAMLEAGIISGRGDRMLAPKAFISRAEVAAIVQRVLQNAGLI